MSGLRGWANRSLWHIRQVGPRSAAFIDRFTARFVVPLVAAAGLIVLALTERARVRWRRFRGKRPRLVWGPSAILNNKYWSEAVAARGYESVTYAHAPIAILAREDFDVYRDDVVERSRVPERLHPYVPFAWALRHGDVFFRYFDGGYLSDTPLEWRELDLMRLAGKKLVVSPFGGDIAIPGHLGVLEEPLLRDYPDLPKQADLIKRRVLHLAEHADANVLTIQPGFQPGVNVLWGNQLGIDTEMWSAPAEISGADGSSGEVVVLHAPNHREIKGTALLERAVEELRDERMQIRLEILEGRPNTEVRAAMATADIVADQFVFGYGLFATEAMASGKPVLSNLSHLPELFSESIQMRACPIVSSTPETLKDDLRSLTTDPGRRRELGEAGRRFVAEYHSYEAVAKGWEAIAQFAWARTPLPQEFAVPED